MVETNAGPISRYQFWVMLVYVPSNMVKGQNWRQVYYKLAFPNRSTNAVLMNVATKMVLTIMLVCLLRVQKPILVTT